MEHNAVQWCGSPSCQRGSYSFYRSVSCRRDPGAPPQVWSLGEFYFVRCGPKEPVCIAEVILLWEDQVERHLLASSRLYFLPEDTPTGRTGEHGEDEVLAVSKKVVVRIEDLMRWSCPEPAGWKEVHNPPGTTQVPPSCVQNYPGATEDAPSCIQNAPGCVRDPPGTTQDNSGTTEDTLSCIQNSPGCLQNPPGTTQDPPNTIQNVPGCLQNNPGTSQDPPNCFQDAPGCIQKPPETTKDPSGTTQNSPNCIQNAPSCVQSPNETTQDPPGTSQDPPNCIQNSPVCIQKPPETIQDPPNCIQNAPGCVQIPNETAQDPPGTRQDPTNCIQNAPGCVQIPNETAQDSPGTSQDSPNCTQNSPGCIQNLSGTTQEPPGYMPNSPGTTQEPPGYMPNSPGTTQEPPGYMPNSPGTTQEPPGCIQNPPNCTQTSPLSLPNPAGGIQSPPGSVKNPPNCLQSPHGTNQNPLRTTEPLKVQTDGDAVLPPAVKVLSYPQYCRFRSLQRRLQAVAGVAGPPDPHLLALGGLRGAPSRTRVLYCRDTFTHPTLESCSSYWSQFRCTLSLKGRPRKRRDGKEASSPSQSQSWIEKMKENVTGYVEMGSDGGWLPHPEEQLFLDQLLAFMEHRGQPIHKVPNLGFKKIDLFLMFSVVQRLGGYEKVTTERLWKVVYNELGGCPGSTSAATCTRRHYERLMLSYEQHVRAGGPVLKVPECTTPPRSRAVRGRKPPARGRKPCAKTKETNSIPPLTPPTALMGTSSMVAKRRRGRPPGRRNKATLVAQAKLLAQQTARFRGACTVGGPITVQQVFQAQLAPPANMPLTPDLSPMSTPLFLPPFHSKPGQDQPRPHTGGGLLGGFSPTKGLCPLDVFRTRLGLQPVLESPAPRPAPKLVLLQQAVPPPPPSAPGPGAHQAPPPQLQQPSSGCAEEEGAPRESGREGRLRPPLPPLRVLPLDLDCSVQVRQLMRTPLGSAQLQSFTRRLSEVLTQDLGAKGPASLPSGAPITPPPEQATPINLSQRPVAKRPASPTDPLVNGVLGRPPPKKPRGEGGDQSTSGGGVRGMEEMEEDEEKVQEEPADLSSPSRIRAFLMDLPPFQVKLEQEDLSESGRGGQPLLAPMAWVGGSGRRTKEEVVEEVLMREEEAAAKVVKAPELKAEGQTELDARGAVGRPGSPDRQEVLGDEQEARCNAQVGPSLPPPLPPSAPPILSQQS